MANHSRLILALVTLAIFPHCGSGKLSFFERVRDTQSINSNESYQTLRLGTRAYLASSLTELFGTSAEVTEIIGNYITQRLSPFGGGPCDRYAKDCPLAINGSGRVDPAGESQSSVVPTATTARMGLMIRACEKLVSNEEALRFAIAKVHGVRTSQVPSLKRNSINNAFDFFFPGIVPPDYVTAQLQALAQDAEKLGGPNEAWRFVLLALCSSPGWQIP